MTDRRRARLAAAVKPAVATPGAVKPAGLCVVDEWVAADEVPPSWAVDESRPFGTVEAWRAREARARWSAARRRWDREHPGDPVVVVSLAPRIVG